MGFSAMDKTFNRGSMQFNKSIGPIVGKVNEDRMEIVEKQGSVWGLREGGGQA